MFKVQGLKLEILGIFFFLFSCFASFAETITKVDTVKYGEDSLVIEKSVSIVDTLSMGNDKVEMADALRSNGKIYIVVLVLLIVLLGVLVFLINIDRRIKKLEETKE